MHDLKKEFLYRRRVTFESDHAEVSKRLIGFLNWMEAQGPIAKLLKNLNDIGCGEIELTTAIQKNNERFTSSFPPQREPPTPSSLEEIASFGWALINEIRITPATLSEVTEACGISAKFTGGNYEAAYVESALQRYIQPFCDYIEHRLPVSKNEKSILFSPPAVIHDSLKLFQRTNQNSETTCFIIMRFGKTGLHSEIEKTIKSTLKRHGITGLLARDREFHDDLFPNILTYLHGCNFGIAVFERLETEEFNPNVALEVGYLLGLKKHVLLLKDQTLKALHTDLVGKLYREFDPQNPAISIPSQIEGWLTDKGLA